MRLREILYGAGLCSMAGVVLAESLPPLRVDPALLGQAPARKPAPAAPLAVPAAPSIASAAPPIVNEVPQRLEAAAAPRAVAPSPAASAATAARADVQPPQVAERPTLPPLYSAHAAAGELPAPALRGSESLAEIGRGSADTRPTFLIADTIRGRTDYQMIAEGSAELRKIGTVLEADKITYWSLEDEVEALGNVRLQHDRDSFTGPKLRMNVEESTGFFEQPSYVMPRTVQVLPGSLVGELTPRPITVPITGRGEAERIEFQGDNLYQLKKATYTTCEAGNQDWVATVADLRLDYNREVAEGSDGTVLFKGVPILHSPWLDFSLDNQRKSGLLAPTIGSTSTGGAEASIPWYWNIAPDKDATITPRLMQKRGLQWNIDYRDIVESGMPIPFENHARFEYLPEDMAAGKRRYGYTLLRSQNLGHGFTGNLNVSGVSDSTYFRDLSKPGAIAQTNYLLRQGSLAYLSNWWTASAMVQRYQVLQDPSLPPVDALYSRLPQLNVAANRYDLPLGGVFNFAGEAVNFQHPTSVTGWRNSAYPQLSFPVQNSYLQVTPKVGVSVTRYQLDRQAAGVPGSLTRNVPIFSLDSALTFERETDFLGSRLLQTLEPRLYYLYVPYRDQSRIPVFDTGLADFNFAQIFSENRYSGGDRIGDANQLTAAVTSRFIDPTTGTELLRAAIGQRYYFNDQRVVLPGETIRTGRSADFLAAASGLVMPKTHIDAGWQYNPRDRATERLNIGARYQPEIGKVFNAGYRYTRDLLGQVDVSAQWPLKGGWHVVGRYNYSTQDRRAIETLGGVEYDAGCWIARVVVQSIATQLQHSTTSLFVQLELNGFSRIGSNPLDILRRNVPGYSPVNLPPTPY